MMSSKRVDQIRQAILDGQDPIAIASQVTGFTLGAAAELCCANWDWERLRMEEGVQLFSTLESQFPSVKDLNQALRQGRSCKRHGKAAFRPDPRDLCTLRQAGDITSVDFQLFLKRFSGALEAVGFGSELSHAIAAALGEMADNIVQHANQPSRAHGIVAYETNERSMIFVVVDVGQGILRSLRQLSKWQHLQSHKEALFAAVCEGATSRIGAVQGTGFKQVHRALASHNGVLRFRTGDTVLTLTGASDPKTAIAARVAPMGGFQICVSCNL